MTETMAETPARTEDLDSVEIWESTTAATIWIWTLDRIAGNGSWKPTKVGGPNGNTRIQLTVRERRANQERIPQANAADHDPFINGMLVCRQGGAQSPNGYTDDQLIALLSVPGDRDADFERVATALLEREVVIRRLLALADRHAPAYRKEFLEELVDDRYRVGWTQRSQRTDLPEKGVGNGVLITR